VLSEAVEIGEVISGALGVLHLEGESKTGLLLSDCGGGAGFRGTGAAIGLQSAVFNSALMSMPITAPISKSSTQLQNPLAPPPSPYLPGSKVSGFPLKSKTSHTFMHQNPLKQRIFIPQHKTLIRTLRPLCL
jgi:hypothetical protein